MPDDVFGGPIVIGAEVERAVMETLAYWMPTYLQEIELQLGRERGRIPAPRTYTTRNRFEAFPDDQMPMCIVVSPGLAEQPVADGEGNFRAWFGMGVGCLAVARDDQAARLLAQIYVAAARSILLHDSTLKAGGTEARSSGVEWVDESYDEQSAVTESQMTVRAAYGLFRVNVEGVVSRWTGPITPPDPVNLPGSQWPTADTIDIEVVI